jgi:hypothetical protein
VKAVKAASVDRRLQAQGPIGLTVSALVVAWRGVGGNFFEERATDGLAGGAGISIVDAMTDFWWVL